MWRGRHTVVEDPHAMVKGLNGEFMFSVLKDGGDKGGGGDGDVFSGKWDGWLGVFAGGDEGVHWAGEGCEAVGFDVFVACHGEGWLVDRRRGR